MLKSFLEVRLESNLLDLDGKEVAFRFLILINLYRQIITRLFSITSLLIHGLKEFVDHGVQSIRGLIQRSHGHLVKSQYLMRKNKTI